MQIDPQARHPSQSRTLRLNSALAILAALLALVMPFAPSAFAQGSAATATPQATTEGAPAAQAPMAATPATQAPAPVAPPAASSVPSHSSTAATPSPAVAPAAPVNATAPESPSGNTVGANPAAVSSPTAAPSAAGEPSIGGELLPQKLSLVQMYLDADRVVKAVMIGLAFASLVSWTVFLAKTLELGKARREVRRGLRVLIGAASFAQAHDQFRNSTGQVGRLMQAAAQEIRLSANSIGDGMKERIALQLERMEMAASRRTARGTGVLATIGSTGVFVGLFGTVWGIMNSFIGISNAHTTNLAVVAPGIAQALLATAMGLIAAIPAVVIYNVLTRQTANYRALLGDASAQIMRLVSRDLDRAKLPLAQAAE